MSRARSREVRMVNVPKSRNTYCAKCNKHGKFKVPYRANLSLRRICFKSSLKICFSTVLFLWPN